LNGGETPLLKYSIKRGDGILLKVYDKNMRAIGVLENAFSASVQRRANQLWTASFSLPENDPKNNLCKHFNYVEFIGASGRNYGLYRIMPKETRKKDGIITYQCEHVLATLLDDVIDGYLQFTNYTTREVIGALLDLQTTKNWILGQCDFTRYFHYSFENENGLLAPLLSIPQPFDEPYLFTFDTTVYPWVLNLVRPSDEVKAEIRWGKDMMDFNEVVDPTEIVNYIIPKGAGEGVNQLTIESVNGGVKYLKDDASIAEWGLHKYIWVDRRFENPESLKASAQALLNQWKDPKISFECPSTDLSILPEYSHEQKILYGVTRIIVEEKEYLARIVGESISDILGAEHDVRYEINNKLDDIATVQADIERKIEINEAYSQGATNMLAYSYCDNADPNSPAVIRFYLPEEMVRINKVLLTYETTEFRTYGRATKGGGATTATSSSGGGTTVSSSSGGGVAKSTAAGGGSTQTSSNGGGSTVSSEFSNPTIFIYSSTRLPLIDATFDNHYHAIEVNDQLNHRHIVNIPSHTHTVNIPSHTHEFNIPNHTHTVTIPNHTHTVSIPNHTHEIEHGIFLLDRLPTKVTIKVDGNIVPITAIEGEDVDLIPYLSMDEAWRIRRGWHTVEIAPNDLGRINAQLITQFFIQSRGEVAL